MDRRTFLRNAALTGGAVALGSTALSGCWWGDGSGGALGDPPGPGGRTMLEYPATASPISHVVMVMMENRSFDHWLGWLANDEAYIEAGLLGLRRRLHHRRGDSPDLSGSERPGRHVPHARPARRREPLARLRPPRPRPWLDRGTRRARRRLPRRGVGQRPVRPRLVRGRRPAVHLPAREAVHHLRPLPRRRCSARRTPTGSTSSPGSPEGTRRTRCRRPATASPGPRSSID